MFDKVLNTVEDVTVGVTFLVMTVLAFVNVVSRYAFHGSLSWSNEIVTACAVYMIMIGTSAAIRLDIHPGFTLLRDSVRGGARSLVIVAIGALSLALFLILAWLGFEQVTTQMGQGRTTPGLGIPQWILSFALPIGAVLGAIRIVQQTLRGLRAPATETGAGVQAEMV